MGETSDTNECSKLIFDTAIDDLEWKNTNDFEEYPKSKMTAGGHFVQI